MPDESMPVLIVGGSITGLACAAFLGNYGVTSTVIERKNEQQKHPRMNDAGPRSMELFRTLAIDQEIAACDEGRESIILRVDTLAGTEIERFSMGHAEEYANVTPARQVWCDQDQLEPIVRRRAQKLGASVKFSQELIDIEQVSGGVRSHVLDHGSGRIRTFNSSYVLACDGAQSPIRESLGITSHGPGVLAYQAGILFKADLEVALRGRNCVLCLVDDLIDGSGSDHLNILLRRNEGRWTLSVPYSPDRDDLDEETCVALVRAAVGVADLEVNVIGVEVWSMRALIAERFHDGRVFLVGDSAHVIPPTGGFGGNSCIQDAQNIAWKLAAVLERTAHKSLLDTYAAERRPVAAMLLVESYRRAGLFLSGSAEGGSGAPDSEPTKASVTFGYRYTSGSLIAEESDAETTPVEEPYNPSGRPGTRAPHMTVLWGDEAISLLDVFGQFFVLLVATESSAWKRAAQRVASNLDMNLKIYRIGPSSLKGHLPDLVETDQSWTSRYGVGDRGAVLVRPDGFIAWRQQEEVNDCERDLSRVLATLLGRESS